MRPRGLLLAAVVTGCVATLLAGCSAAPSPTPTGSSASSTSASPSPSSSSATPTVEPTASLTSAATTPVSVPSDGAGLLVAVRLAAHPGYDRFVLEFRDHVPGAQVSYADSPLTSDPSGEPVVLAGDHALVVRLDPSSTFDQEASPPALTYTGPKRIPGSATGPVREAVLFGDFEMVLNWALGVEGQQPFVVTTLASPPRLVIDVASG